MSNTRRGGRNRNPPGYKARIREGKRAISAYIEPALFDAVHEITSRDGTTIQAILERFCREFVRSKGKLPGQTCG
jgi:hypothetical protein